ncbi:MAG: ABC transporter substrate-binding protein, partial [Alphaproteobacteria bacterium]
MIKKTLTMVAATAALSLVASSAALAEDELVVGAALSITGKYSTNGEHTKNGYELAVEHINARGGVKVGDKNLKLRIIYYDDESTPARGAQLAERLISQDGVKLLLGPYSSGLTKAIAPVTEKHGIPMVEGNGASRSLFTQGYKYLFAVLSTSEQYLASAIDLAAEKAREEGRDPSSLKIAMAMENDPFSQDVRIGVIDTAEKYGMKIVIDD